MSIHDNPNRAKMILGAIKMHELTGHEPTLHSIASRLPGDFDLLEEELAEAMETLPQNWDSAPAAVSGSGEGVSGCVLPAAAKLTFDQAQRAVESAHKRLDEARLAVRLAQQKHQDTKGVLALAIEAWRANAEPGTQEQREQAEIRAHLAGEQKRRELFKAAGITTRMDGSKHPATDPITGRQGFKGNRRGAYPSSFHHRNTNDLAGFQGGKKPAAKA